MKKINKKSIIIGTIFWGFVIVALAVWGLSCYADDKTIDCGDSTLLILWQTSPQYIEIDNGNKYGQLLGEMIEMRHIKGSHETANEYRKMFGWGLFPPKDVRNAESQLKSYLSIE